MGTYTSGSGYRECIQFFVTSEDQLKLFASQLGWYHATPKGDTRSRVAKLKDKDVEGLELSLPECEADFLVPLFYELDLARAGMGGMEPLSWSDIKDWQEVTGYDLPFWNLQVLRNMSKAYVAEYHAASDVMRPAPYSEQAVDITQELRDRVSKDVKSIFAEMKSRQNNN